MNEPEKYVDLQRLTNLMHTNGNFEGVNEGAMLQAGRFCTWIKNSKLPATSFLDAGCRTGYAMDKFISEFPAADVQGIDIVPEFVAVASLRGEVKQGDLHNLPYEDQQFDWVFCSTAIEHCYDAPKAAKELLRVAKYGAYIFTDLEDKERFDMNKSHFTYHNDPCEWIDVFRDPAFWLMSCRVPAYTRVEMLWARREFVYNYDPINWEI